MPLRTNKYSFRKKRKTAKWPLILLVVWLAAIGFAIHDKRGILDDIALFHYNAPAEITTLANDDTLTSKATRILEVNHPIIDEKASFAKVCPNDGGEKTIVLGCYHSNQAGIYVLNVTDPRLNGVEQVTLAHEMLHAAYDRLSGSERSKVDAMLLDYYHNDLKDPRIISTINAYKKSEPTEVVNEMHSVFGTEIADLPAPLEAYYAQYFSDRSTVTSFAAQYQGQFTNIQTTVTSDDKELAMLQSQINTMEADLNTKLKAIQADATQLNTDKTNDGIDQYNAGVPGYNALVDQYNNEISQVKALVDQYNALVDQTKQESLIENQLYQELSGSPSTISN